MAYTKQNWATGQVVTAAKLNHMEDGIDNADAAAASAASAAEAKYTKPSSGIPKTDLAPAVQTSLDNADSALQEHQDISGKLDASNVSHETWTFTLEDDTTVDKEVCLWTSVE